MTPRITDARLLADLLSDIRSRADDWKLQGAKAEIEAEERECRQRAAVLEMLAADLEQAAQTRRTA